MFANQTHRLDFVDTRSSLAESVFTLPGLGRHEAQDASDPMAQTDAADRMLLRLVICAAAATLLLALASSFGV